MKKIRRVARKNAKKFVNNADLMEEIHKSKMTFCYSYDDHLYGRFDAVIVNPDKITKKKLVEGKESRAKRISKRTFAMIMEYWESMHEMSDADVAKSKTALLKKIQNLLMFDIPSSMMKKLNSISVDVKPKQSEFAFARRFIPDHHVVFRFMTDDHIPLDEVKLEKDPNSKKKEKCMFPPFKHYVFSEDGGVKEVLRSHWNGGFKNGKFMQDHGNITDKLAAMQMMMCKQ